VINCSFAARITTEATTCLATNLNKRLQLAVAKWGNAANENKQKKNTAEVETSLHSESSQFAMYKDLEGYHNLTSGATRLFLQNKQEREKDLEELLQRYNFSPSYISERTLRFYWGNFADTENKRKNDRQKAPSLFTHD